ncbi:MAG TPA: class II aldolase/adducin family protein [Desulfuromonadales bacterium]|nr:class II aldolase/adducin family protein [Desulfuromonadales bacterium]
MSQQEGVIKFALEFRAAPPLPYAALREINAWRRVLYLLRLTGQDPARYGGLGYGNISQRLEPFDAPPERRRFVVSGTQTGGLAELNAGHYTTVLESWPEENRLVAEGPIRPSSESLTHGALYALDASLRFIMHAHSPEIWRHAAALGIPLTDPAAAYGTPEMAAETRRLLRDEAVRAGGIFAMGGHEDGLVAFGRTAEAAGTVLLCALARALALS